MALKMQCRVEGDCLHVSVSGEYSLGDATATLDEAIDITVASGVSKMLVDYRQMQGRASVLDDYEYAMHFVRQVNGKRISKGLSTLYSAYVGNSSQPEFAENVAVNRGMVALATHDMHEALAWLARQDGRK